jgi:outer membrane protein TolC
MNAQTVVGLAYVNTRSLQTLLLIQLGLNAVLFPPRAALATEPTAAATATAASEPTAKAAEDASVHKLSLVDLWRLAELRHPTLRAAKEAVNSARYTRDEQKWLVLPSGDFNLFLSGSPSASCKNGNPGAGYNLAPGDPNPVLSDGSYLFGGPNRCIETDSTLSLLDSNIGQVLPIHGFFLRLNANITQPLYTFGKLSAARALGEVGVNLAQAQADGTRGDLAVNLVRAYFGIKAARAALDTVKDGQQQMLKWIDKIDKELDSGKSSYTEIDLMRMKVAESQAEIGVVDVERTLASALAALRYLSQEPNADVDDNDLAEWKPDAHELGYYIDSALAGRPEMRTLDATGEGARQYKRLRFAEFFPDIGILMNIGWGVATGIQDPNNAFMNRFNYLGAGLGVGIRMNLDFGPKAARYQKALADLRQYEEKRREALGGGALEIERAYNDLVEARRRLAAAETAEKRARGWLQGVNQAIDVGTAESRDMIDALRAYFDQHLMVLRSLNDVNVQAALLRRLSGLEVIPK